MRQFFLNLRKNQLGATAIEYGLIVALIGIGITASVQGLQGALKTKFNSVASSLNSAS